MERKMTKTVTVGGVAIGGGSRIPVQSMTNTPAHDAEATYAQIKRLEKAGCDIIRIAVPDIDAAETVKYIKEKGIGIPLVADIHFDWRIALRCVDYGIDKIRINPGNIGDAERVHAVAKACAGRGIPIRIGVNSGSLEKPLLAKFGSPTAEALYESAMGHVRLLNRFDFDDIVISVKSSDVRATVDAYRYISERCDYPLHLGVTEAGGSRMGIIKSAAAFGALICEGIGDTVRVSLTDDPEREVEAARDILRALDCPGHSGLDALAAEFDKRAKAEGFSSLPIKVALMGCIVNGPGEAREADIGIAGGAGEAVLFEHGEIVGKIPEDGIIDALAERIKEKYM